MKKRFIKAILYLVIIIILGIGYKYVWETYNIGIPCPFHYITGKHCPICGTTRMCASIIDLEFKKAYNYNPLVFISIPFLLIYMVYYIYCYVMQKENLVITKTPKILLIILYIILILYFIFRNL